MQKIIFTLLLVVSCATSSYAQRSGPIRQGPWPSAGGGSPLGSSGAIRTTNTAFLNSALLSDGSIYYWGAYTNLSGQATNAIGNLLGKGTNTSLYGNTTNAALYVTDVAAFANNVTISGDLSIPNYPNVSDTLDLVEGKQIGSAILTNLVAMGITNIISANANIVITTNAGVLVFTGSAGGGTSNFIVSAHGTIVVTNDLTAASIIATSQLNSQGDILMSSGSMTAQRVLYLDIAKKIQTSTGVTPTELEYLDGVTSAIQTQLASKQNGSFILTNLIAMGITNIVSGNANIVITTNTGVLVFTGSTISGVTNFAGIIVTNALERPVLWTSTTNLSLSWNGPNEVIWSPVGVTASLVMTGTPGNSTNAQVMNLKLRLTDAGTVTITFPTNGIDGLSPFVITAPSTNEFALIYDGQTFRIASYQSPSTGTGQTLVVNTNPVVYNPTLRYVPTLITGTGGSSTNFTLLSTNPEMYVDNPTALSITASMGYNDSVVDYWTLITTNGSGTNRTVQFVVTTNNWRFNGVYGTNAPSVITNNTRLEIAGRQKGTNVQVVYVYTPWP